MVQTKSLQYWSVFSIIKLMMKYGVASPHHSVMYPQLPANLIGCFRTLIWRIGRTQWYCYINTHHGARLAGDISATPTHQLTKGYTNTQNTFSILGVLCTLLHIRTDLPMFSALFAPLNLKGRNNSGEPFALVGRTAGKDIMWPLWANERTISCKKKKKKRWRHVQSRYSAAHIKWPGFQRYLVLYHKEKDVIKTETHDWESPQPYLMAVRPF